MLRQPRTETPWGLDRIDQRALPLDGRFSPPGDGAGVQAYVIDTGVRRTHRELAGRVEWVGDFTTGTGERPAVEDADDCDPPPSPGRGHGTHVASILAGRTFGVARAVRVHALVPLNPKKNPSEERACGWLPEERAELQGYVFKGPF